MRELDSLLLEFIETQAPSLSIAEIDCFEAILELPDPTLSSYLLGRDAPADTETATLIERIRGNRSS